MNDALRDIAESARGLWRNRRALLMFFVTYIVMLGTTALFVTTREATIRQVLLTFATLLAAPALFFLLQAMCVNFTETTSVAEMLKQSLKNFWKLMIASIPVILVAVALYLLLGKIEAQFTSPHAKAEWPRVIFSTLRLLLFGLVVPLTSIHLWIALTREDVRSVLRSIRSIVAQAFAPRSVLTYACGLVLFGVLPYLLAILRTSFGREWVEVTLLSARLFLAFCFILLGWVITVGALHRGMRAES